MFGHDKRLDRLDKLIEMQFELNREVMRELLKYSKTISEVVKDIYECKVQIYKQQKVK